MADTRVLDTNVLIVASAGDPSSPFPASGSAVEEPVLQHMVLNWLDDFVNDAARLLVLDSTWMLMGEYQNKLGSQDFGLMALLTKMDRQEVVWVMLEADVDGNAVLPGKIAEAVPDLADRKIVAAVLAAQARGHSCRLVNASDTDWLDNQYALWEQGIVLEHLLEHEWLRQRWELKHTLQPGAE